MGEGRRVMGKLRQQHIGQGGPVFQDLMFLGMSGTCFLSRFQ